MSPRRLGLLVGLAVFVTACGAPAEPRSSISIGSDGLRTFTVIREIDGNPVTCGLPSEPSPVRGVLAGDPQDPDEPAWLVDDDRRLSVVWPEGFTMKFKPDAVLSNEKGQPVARAGDLVELTQLAMDSAAGTLQDPYIASCRLFGETYVYQP